MSRQSKRTSAPAPQAGPPLGGPGGQAVVPPPIPSMFGFGSWCPPNILPQPTTSSPAYCRTGLQQMGSSSTQVPWWTPPGVGAPSAQDQDVQAWGVDLHPPSGFVNLLNKNASNPTQDVNNGSSSQPINICDDTDYSSRTEKRLAWTKEEDLILVGAWHLPSTTSLIFLPLHLIFSHNLPTMSDSSYHSDDSDELAPSNIMKEYAAEQSILDSFARKLSMKIKASFSAGMSKRHSGPRKTIRRDHVDAHQRLVEDYFAEEPLYPESVFRIRFRMKKSLFLRIVDGLGQWSPYFIQRSDCSGRTGLSPLQKCTAAMRMLAYGTPADALDEYLKIGKSTALECLDKFAQGVIEVFGGKYMRRPTQEDLEHILQVNESRGFPGMLGSIDCMHWRWEKCPLAWRGQFTRGDYGVPTMVLEAVASHDLHIWHAFFGVAGSNNDLNVLNRSPLFLDALKGTAPEVKFSVNRNDYSTGYYLADGIYPEWAAFMKTIRLPQTEKEKMFARFQEGARKDVERAFGVLQSRFSIVRRPARLWKRKSVGRIMLACVILHNMIVEDEKDEVTIPIDLNENPGASIALPPEVNVGGNICFADVLRRKAAIRARPQHAQLKNDLIEHIWEKFPHKRHINHGPCHDVMN